MLKGVLRITLCFLFFPLFSLANESWEVSGVIRDKNSKKPVPFANIQVKQAKITTTSDIDGRFSLTLNANEYKTLLVSHVSYQTNEIEIPGGSRNNFTIWLQPKSISLKEVQIYPTENPAFRIIDSVITNSNRNDPRKLKNYTCKVYEKVYVEENGSTSQSRMSRHDSILKSREITMDGWVVLENIVEKVYAYPDRDYKKIVASKLFLDIGLPPTTLTTSLQETSLYNNIVDFGMIRYASPLQKGYKKDFLFEIVDTTLLEMGDTVFHVSYRSLKGNYGGLIAINSNGWAILNNTMVTIPRDSSNSTYTLSQIFEQIDGKWFPFQQKVEINMGYLKIIGKSYYTDVKINQQSIPKGLGEIGLDISSDAKKKDTVFWAENRLIPLTEDEKALGREIDSILNAGKMGKIFTIMGKTIETMTTMKLDVGIFSIDLDKIVNYQVYQKWYLGLGLSTNQKFSKTFDFSGYWGYGFGDKKDKYGVTAGAMLYRPKSLYLKLSYHDDASAVGQMGFNTGFISQFFISRVDYTREIGGALHMNPIPYLRTKIGLYQANRTPGYGYTFVPTGQTNFSTTVLQLDLRYAFREARMKTAFFNTKLSGFESKYPIINVNYIRGIKDFLSGDFNYDRLDVKIEQSIAWRKLGKTRIELLGGCIFGEVPYSLLNVPAGIYRVFNVMANNTFTTMRDNEFTNDKYLNLYFSHDFYHYFLRLKNEEIFSFQPQIITNIGWGTVQNKENHEGVNIQDMHFGYFESGLIFHKLLFTFDLGFMYRYGAYSNATFKDNFTFLIGYSF